jgi:hypothetical protein
VLAYTFHRQLPLDASWDVIIVGGGPAGCTAAVAAAREGAKTLLLEATECLGGMSTSGLVPTWCPFSDGERFLYQGLAKQVFDRLKAQMPHVPAAVANWVPIDAEALKRLYDTMVSEAGAKVLFHTLLCGADVDDQGNVTAVIAANKGGLTAYRAQVYVDCTGDADLVAYAGAPFHKGDELSGELQPGSHCFVLTNVDDYGYLNGPWLNRKNNLSPIHKIVASADYPLIEDAHMCSKQVGPGAVGFNAGHVYGVDGTDPESVSRALMQGRQIAAQLTAGLRQFHPTAFGNAFLAKTGSLMGIRESRRIIGDYTLTVDDYARRRSFPDEICRNNYGIDIHGAEHLVEKYADLRYRKGESHGIPYRCLVPKDLRNVLVAGRSISSDRIVNGSVRVMPVCLAMGEAAGLAAALAAQAAAGDVHQVDTHKLRERLRQEGAYLP